MDKIKLALAIDFISLMILLLIAIRAYRSDDYKPGSR